MAKAAVVTQRSEWSASHALRVLAHRSTRRTTGLFAIIQFRSQRIMQLRVL